MGHAHNVLIRGLNSIYQQGAYVSNPQDVLDFLFFCSAWVKTVEHHHHAEEKTLFPELEKLTKNPDIMAENKQQHDAFLNGLTDFEHYAESTTPERYRWHEAKAKLDAFTPALIKHLRDEIVTILSLKQYDSTKLRAVWDVTENAAKGDILLPNMFVSSVVFSFITVDSLTDSQGHHSSHGARLCGQDLRRRYSSISAVPVLFPLSD
jgi:hemerythrin-like domain-containing protein